MRRQSVAIVWLIGGFVGIGLVVEGWNDVRETEMKFAGAGVLVEIFIVLTVSTGYLLRTKRCSAGRPTEDYVGDL